MKSFLLVNKGQENAKIQIALDDGTLVNNGFNGAITEDGQICLAPVQWPDLTEVTITSKSEPIIIHNDVVVQINDEVIPLIFKDNQLELFFKEGNTTGIIFEKLLTEPQPEVGIKYQILNTNSDSNRRVRIFCVANNTTITPESVEPGEGQSPVFKLDDFGSSYITKLKPGVAYTIRLAGIIDVDIMDTGTGSLDGTPILTDDEFINAVMDLGLEVVDLKEYNIPAYISCEGSESSITLSGGTLTDGEWHRFLVIVNGEYKDIIKCDYRSFVDAIRNSSLNEVLNNLSINLWSDSGNQIYISNAYQQPFSMEVISLDEGVSVDIIATQATGSPSHYFDGENNSFSFCIAVPPDVVIQCAGNDSTNDFKMLLTDNASNKFTVVNNKYADITILNEHIQNLGGVAAAIAERLASNSEMGLAIAKSPLEPNNLNAFRLVNITNRNVAPLLVTTWPETDVGEDNVLAGLGDWTDVSVIRNEVERTVTLQACLTPATLTSSIEIDFNGTPETGLKTLLAAYGGQSLYVDGLFYSAYFGEFSGDDVANWVNNSQDKVTAMFDSGNGWMVFQSTSNVEANKFVTVSILGNGTKWTPYPTLAIHNYTPENTSFTSFSDEAVSFSLSALSNT